MVTKQDLEKALLEAVRSGNVIQKQTLRMLLSSIKFYEIEKRVPIDENTLTSILQKEIKSRKETLLEANKLNRQDIISDVEAEITVIEGFLPKMMPEEELITMIQLAIQETGANKQADMGKVMKILLPRLQGRASPETVSRLVKEKLQNLS
jgi:uncharacterized protein